MALNSGSFLKRFHDEAAAQGARAINSDATMVIRGFDSLWMNIKQFPWPVVSSQGEIEVPGPLGTIHYEPQQSRTAFQGPVTLAETVAGIMDKALVDLLAKGGKFDAILYEGTPESHLRSKPIYSCFFVIDAVDRDFENRSQPLVFNGTVFFHYFGEVRAGNSFGYQIV